MSVSDVFQRVTSALNQAGIKYMLSGSFASAFFGTPRATQDIDLVIEATQSQLREFVQGLSPDEYYVDLDAAMQAYAHESLFNVIDLSTGWKIDVIIRKSRPFSREEFRRRKQLEMEGLSLFVVSPEDVILSKLEWAKIGQSDRHIQDAANVLRMRSDSLDHAYLERWVAELGLEKQWTEARRAAGASG